MTRKHRFGFTRWRPSGALGFGTGFAILVAGCAERPAAESPQVRFEREVAYRHSCAANLLAQRADENLRTIEMVLAMDTASDPASQLSRRATQAAFDFSRAYQRHASLRASAYTFLDSAVNYARTSADSANVIERYQQDLATLLADQNHACNWNFPF